MIDNFERFDMKVPPVRTKWYLRPLTYILSAPDVAKHKCKITKINTLKDTWYVYPDPNKCKFSVTKMALATEELYFNYWENNSDGNKQVMV